MTSINASSRFGISVPKRFVQVACIALSVFGSLVPQISPAAETPIASATASGGVVTGIVTNKTTGNGLEGALVSLPKLGLTTFVDNTGRFVLNNVPPGTHEVVVSYTGLDENKSTVVVGSGQRVSHDFEMSSAAYLLDTFKVSGEKEGYAAAITAQRNATNLKNVVSMDAFGDLPNLNATELVMRLPGVTFADPGEEVVEGVSIRGQGMGLNSITIDGGLMASYSGMNRQSRMTAFSGSMFESLELIKGQTPDQGADSMGGRVNFKTRSPLNMRESRRTSYNLSAVWAPSFTEQIPMRREHPLHQLINVSHMQKFSIFGSEEANFAVSMNFFFSENAFGYYQTDRDFQQIDTRPAYLWDYRTVDNYNVRKQISINTKFDFRLSPNSRLSMSVIVSDAPEPGRRRVTTRFTTGSQTAQGNVVNGWTDRITTVSAVPAAANAAAGSSSANITQTGELISRNQRLRQLSLNGEHTFNRLKLDWTADASRMRYRTLGPEANLQTRIGAVPTIGPNGQAGSGTNTIVGPNGESAVGWTIDRTKSDLYPTVTPYPGGLDFTNPKYWRPSQLSSNSKDLNEELIKDIRGNATYLLPLPWEDRFTMSVKSGFDIRDHLNRDVNTNRHQWSYIGVDSLPTDSSVKFWDTQKSARNIPYWEPASFISNGQVKDPTLWSENLYFYEQNKYTGNRRIQELIYAGYTQLEGRIGSFGYLGGVRVERTDTNAQQFIVSKTASTNAQRLADPVGAARADYANNYRNIEGTYTHTNPSLHLFRNFTPNLKGRVAWSTGFGRPNMSNSLPTETVSDPNQTVTIGNPALKPQTSKNWDVTMEYYRGEASFTAGWFHKTTKDYIVNNITTDIIDSGPDNGFNGQYAGYQLRTFANAGAAITQGWEFSYRQTFGKFSFLPEVLKGVTLAANYTLLDTHGLFAGTTYLKRDDVNQLIPRSGNIRLLWNHRKFGASILYNYTALNIRNNYNFGAPSRNSYFMPREIVNVGASYQVRPDLRLSFDVANIFNEPQKIYRGNPDQIQQVRIQPPKITMSVTGQF
jgi:iron complex outermembrane recepter protein